MKTKKLLKKARPTKFLDCFVEWDLKKIKSADGGITIEGYANTVDKDRVGDIVLPAAFTKTLPEYMENPVLLFQHDWDKVIGTVVSAEVTDKGLLIKAKISNAKDVEDVRTKIAEGSLRTFSIGYNEVDAVFDERTKTNVIKELELLEISVVTIPANAQAKFTVVTNAKGEEDAEKTLEGLPQEFIDFFVETLKDLGEDETIDAEFIKNVFEIWKEMGLDVQSGEGAATKSYSQPEQDHLAKVFESAIKAADACVKQLIRSHNDHTKAFGSAACTEHLKAMDAYCRSMDEASRAAKSHKSSVASDETKGEECNTVEWHQYARVGTVGDDMDEEDEEKSPKVSANASPKPDPDKDPKVEDDDKKPKKDEGKKD